MGEKVAELFIHQGHADDYLHSSRKEDEIRWGGDIGFIVYC